MEGRNLPLFPATFLPPQAWGWELSVGDSVVGKRLRLAFPFVPPSPSGSGRCVWPPSFWPRHSPVRSLGLRVGLTRPPGLCVGWPPRSTAQAIGAGAGPQDPLASARAPLHGPTLQPSLLSSAPCRCRLSILHRSPAPRPSCHQWPGQRGEPGSNPGATPRQWLPAVKTGWSKARLGGRQVYPPPPAKLQRWRRDSPGSSRLPPSTASRRKGGGTCQLRKCPRGGGFTPRPQLALGQRL